MKVGRLLIGVLGCACFLVATSADGGAKDGPRRWTRSLKPNEEVTYKITFVAHADPRMGVAEFSILGDGSTDVDVFVFDSNNNRVDDDTGFSDLGFVRWRPKTTGEFTIKVRNLDKAANVVHMGHN